MKNSVLHFISTWLLLLIFYNPLFATDYRGASITYRQIGSNPNWTYEITITTYTKTSSCGMVCRPTLDSVHLGDGSIMQFVRTSETFLPNDITENRYVETYIYPGNGTYIVYCPQVPCAYAILIISNTYTCPKSSITFGEVPIFFGQPNKTYIHNVAAIDSAHDSLSFQMVQCLMDSSYMFPTGISINAISGQINWPVNGSPIGDYSFAVLVNEWRGGILNGSFKIAYTISVNTGADTLYNFTPPNLSVDSTGDYYKIVNPGDTVSFKIKYFDNDSAATLTAYSEALLTSDTPNIQITNGGNTDSATVTWIPDATHSRAYPWAFVFRGTSGVRQLDLTVLIYVNGTQIDSCYALNNVSELNDKKTSLKIFPNPSSSEIVIDTSPFYQDEDITLTIYNIFAEIVKVEKRNEYGKNFSIDIKCFPAGLYMARIENKFGQSIGKFVKN